ncbi:hypothetical protein GobsT_21400 [Gemmata obscuriglobus]|uniref:Uncharacterized protein n=1 Tax=Gemmata obscuriglobus TaxID=114 RepID=A0A2Z3H0I3_9BACT|nr:hypothetical protein [Gemmata obscuriglobus]AWM39523.1 hypothetical protein C1280_22695 [Gemmata obscuriglobus]QEG27386.1 hypothetical protein GobsT_21400 [Gemmata obscuriglobus]VTS04287.1 unnamed protein product [Gemmata obscuriglobus UQM 2246]
MPQLSESAAEKLSAEQATALARILDLQARWENHRDDPAKTATSAADLQARQKAFEAFRAALREYTAAHNDSRFPEPTQNIPERLVIWCRALRAVFRRSEGPGSAFVLMKVHRLADRIAARTGLPPVERAAVTDRDATIRELDAVIAWCDRAAPPSVKGDAA